MMTDIQIPWIEKGYEVFAYEGPGGLKVERLARSIGKNKSSFYHHFADLEVFTNLLLEYHMDQVAAIAVKEANAASLEELIDILVEQKVDLLFSRQLRIHREVADFEVCFLKTNEVSAASIMDVWSQTLGLEDNSYLASLVYKLSLENFFLQITDETLNHAWLTTYFKELKTMIAEFKKAGTKKVLDGTV